MLIWCFFNCSVSFAEEFRLTETNWTSNSNNKTRHHLLEAIKDHIYLTTDVMEMCSEGLKYYRESVL